MKTVRVDCVKSGDEFEKSLAKFLGLISLSFMFSAL